jgi:hypothetical protein
VNLLVDVEEWGQVTLVNMLTRYARTQFQVSRKEISRISFFASNYTLVKNQINQYCGSGIFFPNPDVFPIPESGSLISDLGSNKQQSKQKVAISLLKLAKKI